MARRSPARLLAPLALVGFVLALLLVLNGGGPDGGRAGDGDSGSSSPASATATPTRTPRPAASKKPRSYTVKPGDTPSAIADRTGVSLEEIERLNPDLDPQLLSPGDRIKLRP